MEELLIEWAVMAASPRYEPGRPDKSIEYRIMTGDLGGGAPHGDGGMEKAYARHGEEIGRQARVRCTQQVLKRLRRYDKAAFEAVVVRYATKPGRRLPAAQAAKAVGVSESQWRKNQDRAMAFLAGAMEE